jgi:hypothetical protein
MFWVMVQENGSAIPLVPEFDTAQEADAWANEREIYGTPLTVAAWEAGPYHQATLLRRTKRIKEKQLRQEAKTRAAAVHPLVDQSIVFAMLLIKDAALTTKGLHVAAVGTAYIQALPVMRALTTPAQVEAYDVTTDPAWP